MYVVGIDPGLSGAIAALALPKLSLVVFDIPTFSVQVGKKTRQRCDMRSTWLKIQGLAGGEPNLVVLEDIGGGRPMQQGATAFGIIAGALEMACVAASLPLHKEEPAVWKKALKLKAHKDRAARKDEARQLASRLFPAYAHLWALKSKDGRAEAALLAWYGATKILGVVA